MSRMEHMKSLLKCPNAIMIILVLKRMKSKDFNNSKLSASKTKRPSKMRLLRRQKKGNKMFRMTINC